METRLRPPNDPDFRLIETCAWYPGLGIRRRDLHLARLLSAARRLGITPAEDVAALLDSVTGTGAMRVRLTMDGDGHPALTRSAFPETLPRYWRVGVASARLDETDPWRGVKSTMRGIYDTARAELPEDLDEVVFLNRSGRFADGTITNLFVDLGQGLVTPPLADGALPGVLRAAMLARGLVHEAPLRPADLSRAARVFVGNSLRGLIPAWWQG